MHYAARLSAASTCLSSRRCGSWLRNAVRSISFFCEFVKPSPSGAPYYNGRIDVLTCDAIHMLDTAMWLGDSPLSDIVSVTRQSVTDQNVKYNALMQFENGSSGFYSANWNSGRRHLRLDMHGQNCCALIDVEEQGTYFDPDHPEGITMTAAEAAGSDSRHRMFGFFDESREFIDAVKSGSRRKTQSSMQSAVKDHGGGRVGAAE